MKKLGLFLATITLSFSAFAQTVEQVGQKLEKVYGDHLSQFFYTSNHDVKEFFPVVAPLYNLTEASMKNVTKAIDADDAIEESYGKYADAHPDFVEQHMGSALDVYEGMLLKQATDELGKYNASSGNAFITLLELHERDSTDNGSFNSYRSNWFFQKVRSALKMPAFDQALCVKVIGQNSCPVAKKTTASSVTKKKS